MLPLRSSGSVKVTIHCGSSSVDLHSSNINTSELTGSALIEVAEGENEIVAPLCLSCLQAIAEWLNHLKELTPRRGQPLCPLQPNLIEHGHRIAAIVKTVANRTPMPANQSRY